MKFKPFNRLKQCRLKLPTQDDKHRAYFSVEIFKLLCNVKLKFINKEVSKKEFFQFPEQYYPLRGIFNGFMRFKKFLKIDLWHF